MQDILRRFLGNKLGVTGIIVVGLVTLLAAGAPWIAPYEYSALGTGDPLSPPSVQNWLGTDELGRDVFTRVLYASRIAVMVGALSTLAAAVVGIPIGLIAGYKGGWFDSLVMRVTDAWLAFPIMVLAVAMSAALGPSLKNATMAIAFVTVPDYIRLARGQTLVVKSTGHVESAVVIGQATPIILSRYILPNISSVLIIQSSLAAAAAILTESALSFLGVGVMPPTPSWGAMLSNAQPFLLTAPWMAIAPGVSIFVLVMGINLLGDGLRDALDPKIYH